MSIKQNVLDFAHQFPRVAKIVNESFYMDDWLTGADSVSDAIALQKEFQSLL
jgi:hypothetical protein